MKVIARVYEPKDPTECFYVFGLNVDAQASDIDLLGAMEKFMASVQRACAIEEPWSAQDERVVAVYHDNCCGSARVESGGTQAHEYVFTSLDGADDQPAREVLVSIEPVPNNSYDPDDHMHEYDDSGARLPYFLEGLTHDHAAEDKTLFGAARRFVNGMTSTVELNGHWPKPDVGSANYIKWSSDYFFHEVLTLTAACSGETVCFRFGYLHR
jgi:hypothetical protein